MVCLKSKLELRRTFLSLPKKLFWSFWKIRLFKLRGLLTFLTRGFAQACTYFLIPVIFTSQPGKYWWSHYFLEIAWRPFLWTNLNNSVKVSKFLLKDEPRYRIPFHDVVYKRSQSIWPKQVTECEIVSLAWPSK
jgi:hypothetical protein